MCSREKLLFFFGGDLPFQGGGDFGDELHPKLEEESTPGEELSGFFGGGGEEGEGLF